MTNSKDDIREQIFYILIQQKKYSDKDEEKLQEATALQEPHNYTKISNALNNISPSLKDKFTETIRPKEHSFTDSLNNSSDNSYKGRQ